jgi:hypothetical protein
MCQASKDLTSWLPQEIADAEALQASAVSVRAAALGIFQRGDDG